jgi:16S rRNA (uracil1498-N3)-methyltransferase
MENKSLSNIELYCTPNKYISSSTILLYNDEYKHAVKVMRNKVGDTIYVTNGAGSIFKCEVVSIEGEKLTAKISEEIISENRLGNVFFCIPKLKNPYRFKFAIEKSVELGIVNFIIYESERTVAKGTHLDRWEKIALSAMKQSLSSFRPKIQTVKSFEEISKLNGEKIIFEQNAEKEFKFRYDADVDFYFVFGPEGGLTDNELILFDRGAVYSIGDRRLRSETAIIKVASML